MGKFGSLREAMSSAAGNQLLQSNRAPLANAGRNSGRTAAGLVKHNRRLIVNNIDRWWKAQGERGMFRCLSTAWRGSTTRQACLTSVCRACIITISCDAHPCPSKCPEPSRATRTLPEDRQLSQQPQPHRHVTPRIANRVKGVRKSIDNESLGPLDCLSISWGSIAGVLF